MSDLIESLTRRARANRDQAELLSEIAASVDVIAASRPPIWKLTNRLAEVLGFDGRTPADTIDDDTARALDRLNERLTTAYNAMQDAIDILRQQVEVSDR